jgi:hypothetical protein
VNFEASFGEFSATARLIIVNDGRWVNLQRKRPIPMDRMGMQLPRSGDI